MSAVTTPDNAASTVVDTAGMIISKDQQNFLVASELAPATLEALKILSASTAGKGLEDLSYCKKLTASLEQIRARRNINLFEKLDAIRQDFSGLSHKIAKMEESIIDLKKTTSNLVKSLPPPEQGMKK